MLCNYELQSFARNILKIKIDDQKIRRKCLYNILNDKKIQKLLKEGKLEEAKVYVNEWITNI